MTIEVIVNDATDEDRLLLRSISASFMGSGMLKVSKSVKTPESEYSVQKWSFPRVVAGSHDAPAIMVVIKYNKVNKDKEDIQDYKDNEGKNGELCTCCKINYALPDENWCDSCWTGHAKVIVNGNEDKKDKQIIQDSAAPLCSPVARPPSSKQSNLFESPKTMREEVDEFIHFWKTQFWLPKLMGTDRQAKVIRKAMERPMFRDNYREALGEYAKSKFLRGVDTKNFKFTFDWFMEDDNFDKVLEGKYRDHEVKPQITQDTKYVGDEKDF